MIKKRRKYESKHLINRIRKAFKMRDLRGDIPDEDIAAIEK
jgi:hypothetical protein